jgi:ribosomal protein S18 acetylase RimI-like enzyme
MDKSIIFGQNKASQDQIYAHLMSCDEQFVPKLSSKIDIKEYAEKLYQRAILFEAYHNELIGLVAAYNNTVDNFLFITNVSVLFDYLGNGIAKKLLNRAIQFAMDNKIPILKLEVNKKNEAAISLYDHLGFEYELENEESLFLKYNTNN